MYHTEKHGGNDVEDDNKKAGVLLAKSSRILATGYKNSKVNSRRRLSFFIALGGTHEAYSILLLERTSIVGWSAIRK